MPRSIQEYVYANMGEVVELKDIMFKIKMMAGNQASMDCGRPVPMDIGSVKKEREENNVQYGFIMADDHYDDVNAVGANSQCHRCGGWGHFKRLYSTPAGKGAYGKGGRKVERGFPAKRGPTA